MLSAIFVEFLDHKIPRFRRNPPDRFQQFPDFSQVIMQKNPQKSQVAAKVTKILELIPKIYSYVFDIKPWVQVALLFETAFCLWYS